MSNETAYTDDSPSDYYFPTGVEQWEPDALVFLGWNNKPWKEYLGEPKGYQWDQSSIPKIYKVADSASYIKPYDQRDHSWNDAEYNQSDEVKFLDNTKTLNADYLENLAPAAEYHLREGRTGVAAEDWLYS